MWLKIDPYCRAVKIAVNWMLVGDPRINITGAPVGSICCFGVICALDYWFLCRTLKNRPRLTKILGAPVLSCAAMGVTAWAVYGLVSRFLSRPGAPLDRLPMAAAMFVAIAAAVLVYAVMLGLTRAVTMEDMALIPHGEKLGRVLHLKSRRS